MSQSNYYTARKATPEIYSDFLTNLNVHPVTKSVYRSVNEAAVSRSIRNLINTNKGERLYQPDLGSGIRQMLFEPMEASTANTLRMLIEETITNHEPRAKLLKVDVTANYDANSYVVNVLYMLINKQDPISVNITLQRVR